MESTVLDITGSRSDWGLMMPVYTAIQESANLRLECILTGMHLLPRFAESRATVEKECPGPIHVLPTLEDGDGSNAAMTCALGRTVSGMAKLMVAIAPDIILLQGDRGEMLACAIAWAHLNISIVHMSGGDESGSIDDSIRRAISAFAHIHLTTCAASSDALLRRGESPGRILAVGEPGIDRICALRKMNHEELCLRLSLDLELPIIIVAQHPVTTESDLSGAQMRATLDAVFDLIDSGRAQAVLSCANSDAGGEAMNAIIEDYAEHPGFCYQASYGSELFLNLLAAASVLVGNSSSGILEAPSFGLPVVDIGTRQHGRMRAGNVLDVPVHDQGAIARALETALYDETFRDRARSCVNPYGDGQAAARTVAVLSGLDLLHPRLIAKWLDSGEDHLGFARAFALDQR